MSNGEASVPLSRAAEFREQFGRRIFVADGAMGTMLYTKGVFINRCFDELNIASPALVREVHEDYAKAGAEIIETNTFGATRPRLKAYGLAEKLEAINQAGVKLAREAAQTTNAFVAGAVGPLGVPIEPQGPTTLAQARAHFREQMDVLVAAGIDLIILETFSELNELSEAIQAAREAAGPEMVVVAQVTIDDFGNLPDGADVETYTRKLAGMPCDAVGCNCSVGPKTTLETVEQMVRYTTKPVSAMPNAGHPARVEGRNIYLSSPEYMAQYARRMLWAGARIVGGCCGTTPEHIKAIRSEARSLQPEQGKLKVIVDAGAPKQQARPKVPMGEKSALGAKLAAGKFVALVEILPPRGADASREVAGAALCVAQGIDCINVPDGPRASARLSAQVACHLIERDAKAESMLHFCCRDRNILGIQSELLGAQAMGIRNVLCITGDPPRMGSYPDATAVFDVDSIGLVNIANNLNSGLDIGGSPMGSQTSLLIGVGANPGALNIEEELKRFEAKVQAGAEYAITQPVFDLRLLEEFLRRTESLRIPIICGIWPLTSFRNAEFMVNELRVPVPESFMERMRKADSAEKARKEGVRIAQEMVREVRKMVAGVGLSAPFGRYEMALEVADAIGAR